MNSNCRRSPDRHPGTDIESRTAPDRPDGEGRGARVARGGRPPGGPGQGTAHKGAPARPGALVAAPAEADASVGGDEDEEFRDPYGVASEGRRPDHISSQVRYVLEGIVVIGNKRTKAHTVRKFIPLKAGDFMDPE